MYYQIQRTVTLSQPEDRTFKGRIEKFLKYATDKYGCEFPENFAEILQKVAMKPGRVPDKKVIDALEAEWRVWKPYVDEKSHSRFIADGIKSIFRIHATATFYSEKLNGYIGHKARVVKKLPELLATTVSYEGIFCKNGRRVE